jgi:hypothetical protein
MDGFLPEVAMSASIISVDELDLEISVAYIALGGARQRFLRCPSAENEERVVAAEAEVDRLLDQRLAASAAPAA